MARPPNTPKRRDQIARALMKVMGEKGYAGATTADVAKAAELSRGVVHYHFENKLEILLAMFDLLVADHEKGLEEFLESTGSRMDSATELRNFICFHLINDLEGDPDRVPCWVAVSAEAVREPVLRDRYQEAILKWKASALDIIERGIGKRAFRCADPPAAAAGIVAAMQGYFCLGVTTKYGSVIPEASAVSTLLLMTESLVGAELLARRP